MCVSLCTDRSHRCCERAAPAPSTPTSCPEIPAPTVPLGDIERGELTASLRASAAFASSGLAGTVQSSLTVALGRPGKRLTPAQLGFTAGPRKGERELIVSYRATLGGSVVEDVRGDSAPAACALLDSCGLAGTLTLTPEVIGAPLSLYVEASSRRPVADLLAAADLGGRGKLDGIGAFADLLPTAGGTAVSALRLGAELCSDSVPIGLGVVFIGGTGGHLTATYSPSLGDPGSAVTRCPGPTDGSLSSDVALGSISRGGLRRRVTTIPLTTGGSFSDDGYTVRTMPRLTLTLTRVGMSIVTGPSG